MLKVKRVANEHCDMLAFIGKKYKNGSGWGEWWQNGWFDILEKTPGLSSLNDNGYIGLMRNGEEGFEYWIGMFFKADTKAPEGFELLEIPESNFAVFYLYGNEQSGEIFGEVPDKMCMDILFSECLSQNADKLRFERYNCPRYTAPDKDGNVILDYAIALA